MKNGDGLAALAMDDVVMRDRPSTLDMNMRPKSRHM